MQQTNNIGKSAASMHSEANKVNKVNPMRNIYLEKVTLNIGIGSTEDKFEGAKAILQRLTEHVPTYAKAKTRKPEFGIKKGQVIGAFVTVRGKQADTFLRRALDAADNSLSINAIAGNSLNFGVEEYIYFSGIKYDPKIGMLGLNVNATFARKGMRVERRRRARSRVSNAHKRIDVNELKDYVSKNYGTKFVEEEA